MMCVVHPADNISAVEAVVFHGTRRSLAQSICDTGFAPIDVATQIATVAATQRVSVDELDAHLDAASRFTHLDLRPDSVFVCADRGRAARWASRAPEATWEALWSVYRMRHPELGDFYAQSMEGRLWVLAHQLDDPPAVVRATAPLGALQMSSGMSASQMWTTLGISPQKFYEFFTTVPELRALPGQVTAHDFEVVPQPVEPDLASFLAGLDEDTFRRQARAGSWGELRGLDEPQGPWFAYSDVWERLSASRRGELETLVGRSLSPARQSAQRVTTEAHEDTSTV